jgi:hypothetical protein
MAAAVLQGLLQSDPTRRFLIAFLESIALVSLFYTYAWQALAVAGIIVLACLMWGYGAIRREVRNTVEIRFMTASHKVVSKLMTGSLIFMIIMYAALTNSNGNFFVSRSAFDRLFGWVGQVVNNFYPTVPVSGSFNDFAKALARVELQNSSQFQSLTPPQQDQTLAQAAHEITTVFTDATGTKQFAVNPTDTTDNVLYAYLGNLSAGLRDRFANAFVGAWGLILFVTLRSLGIVAVWAGQIFALIVYELLLAIGIIKISEVPATKETVEYTA